MSMIHAGTNESNSKCMFFRLCTSLCIICKKHSSDSHQFRVTFQSLLLCVWYTMMNDGITWQFAHIINQVLKCSFRWTYGSAIVVCSPLRASYETESVKLRLVPHARQYFTNDCTGNQGSTCVNTNALNLHSHLALKRRSFAKLSLYDSEREHNGLHSPVCAAEPLQSKNVPEVERLTGFRSAAYHGVINRFKCLIDMQGFCVSSNSSYGGVEHLPTVLPFVQIPTAAASRQHASL